MSPSEGSSGTSLNMYCAGNAIPFDSSSRRFGFRKSYQRSLCPGSGIPSMRSIAPTSVGIGMPAKLEQVSIFCHPGRPIGGGCRVLCSRLGFGRRRARGAAVMKIVVDYDVCESNAVCMAVAPEVFEVRDDDFRYVREDSPPEELRAKVEEAVRRCP